MQKPMYFDIHTHVQFPVYDADRGDVLRRAKEAGVLMANVGTTYETSKKAVELARAQGEGVYAVVGIHPTHAEPSHADPAELGDLATVGIAAIPETFDRALMRELAEDKTVVAIGECGLDYFRMSEETREKQEALFHSHIALAREVKKPLMLHVRPGKRGAAYDDALAILSSYGHPQADFHFFAGSLDEAARILDAGHLISFSGVVTFARSYDEVIRYVPLNRIMAETDAPYVAPVPYRGKRNEPAFIIEIYDRIALIRGEGRDVVKSALYANSRSFFRLV